MSCNSLPGALRPLRIVSGAVLSRAEGSGGDGRAVGMLRFRLERF